MMKRRNFGGQTVVSTTVLCMKGESYYLNF